MIDLAVSSFVSKRLSGNRTIVEHSNVMPTVVFVQKVEAEASEASTSRLAKHGGSMQTAFPEKKRASTRVYTRKVCAHACWGRATSHSSNTSHACRTVNQPISSLYLRFTKLLQLPHKEAAQWRNRLG